MRSQQFQNGIHYELQNRAFALSAIVRIANRVQGTQEYIFWSAYESLERFNTPHYLAYAEKLGLDATPSFLTKAKASLISSTPSFLLDELLKLVYAKTKVYMEDLKQVHAQGTEADREFLDYMLAQEQVQIELMELAIKKQYREIPPKIEQFIQHYLDKELV